MQDNSSQCLVQELNKLQAEVKTFVATGGENNPAVARLKEEVLALQREKNIAVADVSRLTERLERTERDIEVRRQACTIEMPERWLRMNEPWLCIVTGAYASCSLQASKQAMQRAVEALQRQLAQGEEERSRLKKELSEMAVKAVAVEKVARGACVVFDLVRFVLSCMVATAHRLVTTAHRLATVSAADPDAGAGPLDAQQPHQGAAADAGRQGERPQGRHQHAATEPAVRWLMWRALCDGWASMSMGGGFLQE